jgi:Tfp pilus assembly protein PilV
MTNDASKSTIRRRSAGLTFLEVIIAASILSIAAIAVLELLASSDSIGLTARRQALAAIEAERALEMCAEAIKDGETLPSAASLQTGMQGEAVRLEARGRCRSGFVSSSPQSRRRMARSW